MVIEEIYDGVSEVKMMERERAREGNRRVSRKAEDEVRKN